MIIKATKILRCKKYLNLPLQKTQRTTQRFCEKSENMVVFAAEVFRHIRKAGSLNFELVADKSRRKDSTPRIYYRWH